MVTREMTYEVCARPVQTTRTERREKPSRLRAVMSVVRRVLRAVADFMSRKPQQVSAECKLDVRANSPRRLYRDLHEFLEENGFEHEYVPLKAERDAINDVAIFESELVAKRDAQGRDFFNLVFGIVLLLTVVLSPIAILLLERSRYVLRTVAKVEIEGEAYRAKACPQLGMYSEIVEIVSDSKIRLYLDSGIADSEYEIARPTRFKPESKRIAEEQELFRSDFEEFLISRTLP